MFSCFTRRLMALLNRTHWTVVPARIRRPHRRQGTFHPRLEALEDRTLLSATLPISIASSGTEMGNDYSTTAPASVSGNGQYEVFTSYANDLVNGVTIVPFSGTHVYLRNLSTGMTTLVDMALNGTESSRDGANYASISADGRYVAFVSGSNDLTNNDASVPAAQVYVRDMQTGQTYLVSLGTDGKPENESGYLSNSTPSIAEDGNGHLLIAYQSRATNLTSGDSNTKQYQIFLAKLNLDSSGNIQYGSLQTSLISADSNGNGAGTGISQGGDSFDPIFSKDGSTLAFLSYAANLDVPGGYNDNNPYLANLFLYSLADRALQLLSAEPTTTSAATGNAASDLPQHISGMGTAYQESISANGQYVVFASSSDNLVPGLPTSGGGNVYRRDLINGTTSLVSISSDGKSGVQLGGGASHPVITPDGRYVAFTADSANLTGNLASGTQVYIRDMQQGQTYLVSLGIDGNPSNKPAWIESIAETSNGQLVIAYRSNATNLTANDTNTSNNQVFVATFGLDSNGNIKANTLSTKLASADSSGNGGNDDSDNAILSKDGSTLAFESKATNLPGETPDNADGHDHIQVFTFNVASGLLTQVSLIPQSGDTADSTWLSSISDTGRFLTYVYTEHTPGSPDFAEVLAWDAKKGTNTRIAPPIVFSNEKIDLPVLGPTVISGDGSTIAFRAGDVYGHATIFATGDWQSGGPTFIRISPSSPDTVFSSNEPSISENGKIIAYKVVPNSGPTQVYVYDNGATNVVSLRAGSQDGANDDSQLPEVSADGSTVVFDSKASDLVPSITDFIVGQDNVFAYNTASKTVSLVSTKAPGVFTTDASILSPSISDNGRYVAYFTGANDLLGNLPFSPGSVFAEDLQQGVPTVIASNSFAHIYSSVLSGDGSTVAFNDDAQLTSTKTLGEQIYSASNWHSSTPTIILVSVGIDNNPNNGGANGSVETPSISDNGQVIAFASHATNLTSNSADASNYRQIFVRNLGTNTTTLASTNSSGSDGGNKNADTPVVSANGSTVLYNSQATDLLSSVSVSSASWQNVYAYLSNTSQPVLISQPSSQTVTAGQTATFTATASGSPTAVVQWQVSSNGGANWTDISGASSTTLTLNNVQLSQKGNEYRAVFSNIYGTVTTNVATLTVKPLPPVVTINPSSQTVTAGQNATFTAVANGNPVPTVQWQVSSDGGSSFNNLSGAASTTLTLNAVTTARNGYEYRAVFTNSAGSVNSAAATLTVLPVGTAATITSGNNIAFTVGRGGRFTVTAAGSSPLTLTEAGALPDGVTFTNNGNGTATLSGTPAAGKAGTYHITITVHNFAGSSSQDFTLTVNPAPPIVPPLLEFFNSLLGGGILTINADETTTITDSLFGFPLLMATFDSSGNFEDAALLGLDITFLIELL